MQIQSLTPLRMQTLDELWQEAETLGFVRVRTQTNYQDSARTGYSVALLGRRKNTRLEVERTHTSLVCALADVINEAREMGLGES